MRYLAQGLGFLSLIYMVLSYLSKNKKAYLGNQLVANILYSLQFLCLGAKSGFLTQCVSSVKTLLFYGEEKRKGKIGISLLIAFELIYLIVGVYSFTGIISLIPIIISIGYTWASWQSNMKITCITGIIVGLLWIVYNMSVGAYISVISSVIESLSGVVGLIKNMRVNKETT